MSRVIKASILSVSKQYLNSFLIIDQVGIVFVCSELRVHSVEPSTQRTGEGALIGDKTWGI